MSGVIDDYVAALRREFDFDPALARRLAARSRIICATPPRPIQRGRHPRPSAAPSSASASAARSPRNSPSMPSIVRRVARGLHSPSRSWSPLWPCVCAWCGWMTIVLPLDTADRPLCLHRCTRGRRDRLVRLSPIAGRARDLPGRPCGVDRRRHRARRLVRQRRADPRPAVGGRRDRPDRRAVVPCHWIGPAPQAHGMLRRAGQ